MKEWESMVVLNHNANPSLGIILISLADLKAVHLLFPLHKAQASWSHFLALSSFFPLSLQLWWSLLPLIALGVFMDKSRLYTWLAEHAAHLNFFVLTWHPNGGIDIREKIRREIYDPVLSDLLTMLTVGIKMLPTWQCMCAHWFLSHWGCYLMICSQQSVVSAFWKQ